MNEKKIAEDALRQESAHITDGRNRYGTVIRVSNDVHAWLKQSAKDDDRGLSMYVDRLIRGLRDGKTRVVEVEERE